MFTFNNWKFEQYFHALFLRFVGCRVSPMTDILWLIALSSQYVTVTTVITICQSLHGIHRTGFPPGCLSKSNRRRVAHFEVWYCSIAAPACLNIYIDAKPLDGLNSTWSWVNSVDLVEFRPSSGVASMDLVEFRSFSGVASIDIWRQTGANSTI